MIHKSPADPTTYTIHALSNGISLLSIQNPHTHASISLSVKTGSYSDLIPGMAHYLEHMLFMGSQKFPNESHFSNLIALHGGSYNAFTANDITNYYFETPCSAFIECLTVFVEFFKKPLFLSSCLANELIAVDNEFRDYLECDDWRETRIVEMLSGCMFGVGNKDSLKECSRKDLVRFFVTEYKTTKMCVAVHCNESVLNDVKGLLESIRDPIYEEIICLEAVSDTGRCEIDSEVIQLTNKEEIAAPKSTILTGRCEIDTKDTQSPCTDHITTPNSVSDTRSCEIYTKDTHLMFTGHITISNSVSDTRSCKMAPEDTESPCTGHITTTNSVSDNPSHQIDPEATQSPCTGNITTTNSVSDNPSHQIDPEATESPCTGNITTTNSVSDDPSHQIDPEATESPCTGNITTPNSVSDTGRCAYQNQINFESRLDRESINEVVVHGPSPSKDLKPWAAKNNQNPKVLNGPSSLNDINPSEFSVFPNNLIRATSADALKSSGEIPTVLKMLAADIFNYSYNEKLVPSNIEHVNLSHESEWVCNTKASHEPPLQSVLNNNENPLKTETTDDCIHRYPQHCLSNLHKQDLSDTFISPKFSQTHNKAVFILPITHKNTLRILFRLPNHPKHYQNNPVCIIEYLLTTPKSHGLLHTLRANNLAINIQTDYYYDTLTSRLSIDIQLTTEGSVKYLAVKKIVISFLQSIKIEHVKALSKHFVMKNLLEFSHKENQIGMEKVSELCCNMQYFNEENLLDSLYCYRYDESVVLKYLECFRKDNMFVLVITKDLFDMKHPNIQREEYYGIQYYFE